jgi:hypothetical protein
MQFDSRIGDCNFQPDPDGLFRCSRCGWTYLNPVRRNCPGPVDPAEVARQKARAEKCEACPDLWPYAGGDFCSLDKRAAPELSVCHLRARFRARIEGKAEECERQKRIGISAPEEVRAV